MTMEMSPLCFLPSSLPLWRGAVSTYGETA